MAWPWKRPCTDLPDNFGLAMGRFRSLTNRFAQNSSLLSSYDKIIQEQVALGIIEKVTPLTPKGETCHYLPHHAVLRPDKATTKVHIVFDCSSKAGAKSISLNDCLFKGPNLIPDLVGMLLRFHFPPIAILSDIEKAFLQIGLQLPDRDVTRFLWYDDPALPQIEGNLATYRFCRIPFGVVSSPFLLCAVLKHHLTQQPSQLSSETKDNMYVDNIFFTAKTAEEAYLKYIEAKNLFGAASLPLHEWASNNLTFLAQLPQSELAADGPVKLLGVIWNLNSDTVIIPPSTALKTEFKFGTGQSALTKRKVLKQIASVFDPLGFWAPTTHFGKVLFQDLWRQGFTWDAPLPEELVQSWNQIALDLQKISNFSIPRQINALSEPSYRLVAFTDASNNSYGAAIYVLSSASDQVESALVFAKMRLKPVSGISKRSKVELMTIPRLELMGVLIGVRALKFIATQIRVPISSFRLFTDSQCVLHWITKQNSPETFVKNRVAEICQATEVSFSYVSTEENPADLLT